MVAEHETRKGGGNVAKRTPKELQGKLKACEVAAQLGISKSLYSRKLNGKVRWSIEEAINLAAFHRVSVESIDFRGPAVAEHETSARSS